MFGNPATTETVRETPFDPIRPDYADFNVDPRASFNWDAILEHLGVPVGQYVVLFAFRSVKKQGADSEKLASLDGKALLDAKDAEGFIHYEPLESLSYCLWADRASARASISSQGHRAAAEYADEVYERHKLDSWMVARTAIAGVVEFDPAA